MSNNPAERLSDNAGIQPYKCFHCAGLIGLSNENKLFIGAAIFVRSVTIECAYCNRHTFWKPREENYNKNSEHNK